MLFSDFVGDLATNKRWGREDELQRVDLFELSPQRLVGVDRKTRCRDPEFCSRRDGALEVVAEQAVDVVDYLHRLCGLAARQTPRLGDASLLVTERFH